MESSRRIGFGFGFWIRSCFVTPWTNLVRISVGVLSHLDTNPKQKVQSHHEDCAELEFLVVDDGCRVKVRCPSLLSRWICRRTNHGNTGLVRTERQTAKPQKELHFHSHITQFYRYGYGLGALERSYYDGTNKVFYGGSELGFVTVSDFVNYPEVTVTDMFIDLVDSLTDIKVCGPYLFVSSKNDPSPGTLHVYEALTRANGTLVGDLKEINAIPVGVGPDNVLVSKDCTLVATADEGEGDYDDDIGFINPVGTVSIVRGPFDTPTVTTVSLNQWTEEMLLDWDVHLPFSRNAMEYWDATLASNYSNLFDSYTPDMNLEPEYLAFGSNETEIYVNLQENNAVVVIDVATNTATNIFPYGLKSGFPVDLVEDGGCAMMPTVEGLYFLRSADSIASFEKDGENYIVTANEGDDVEYGDYGEKVKGKDVFNGTTILFPGMTADDSVLQTAKYFHAKCDATTEEFCASSMALSIGTTMTNFSNVTSPNIYRMVALGGRGISIYKVKEDDLELVWDSGDEFERMGCEAFPWSHNGIQDEEFAAVDGVLYNRSDDDLRATIEELNLECADRGDGVPGACPLGQTVDDRSVKDGYAPETVVVGEACGTMYAVTVSEKNSVGFLYDLADLTSPVLEQVFHLSEVSEFLSPELAYNERKLGEIDSETIQFLTANESPTGKTAVLFSGAFSGSTSLWEFDCDGDDGGGEQSGAVKLGRWIPLLSAASLLWSAVA